MRQALHIFRKDVRYLRIEIGLFLILVASFGVAGGLNWLGDVVELAALYVVVRLIHAEAIPGDRQFWLTRPYRPMSLLGAKLLFLFALVCLPIGIAQAVIAVRLGYPLVHELPALLWTQVLIFFAAALPVAALAALTASIVPFISSVLLLVVVTLIGGRTWQFFLRGPVVHVPVTVDWIGDFALGAAISGIAAVVLLWLYRDRRVLFSRVFATVVFYCALAVWELLPAAVPLKIQSWFSKEPGLASNVRVTVDATKGRAAGGFGRGIQVPLPLVVTGLPAGVEARPDDLSVSFEWPGLRWSPATRPGANPHASRNGEAVIEGVVEMDPALFRAKRQVPMTLRGAVYLTLFGEPERRRFVLGHGPVNLQDGLQCWEGEFAGAKNETLCRSILRWPGRLVSAEADGGAVDFSSTVISYSPFPADLNLNPVELRWSETILADEAVLVTKRPLVHFRREFELRGVRLSDFEPRAPFPPAVDHR